jgi:hypothetical protein
MTNTLPQNSENQIPSGAALHPTSPTLRNPKNLLILRKFTLFYTKKYWICNTKITKDKPEVLTWNEANTQTGLVSEVQTHGPIPNKRFAAAMTCTVLFQCMALGCGGAGRSGVKPPECQSLRVSKRRIAQPCLSCSSHQTERIPRLDLFLCNDVTFVIPIKYRQFHQS